MSATLVAMRAAATQLAALRTYGAAGAPSRRQAQAHSERPPESEP
jgi:hypothetical protein